MKISELIEKLENIKTFSGDLEVASLDPEDGLECSLLDVEIKDYFEDNELYQIYRQYVSFIPSPITIGYTFYKDAGIV